MYSILEQLAREMKEAAGAGDEVRLGSVENNAKVLLTSIKSLATIPGQADNASCIEKEFNDYFGVVSKVARIMPGREESDATTAIASMISALKILKAEIADGDNDLSNRTESEAGSLQKTASSVH